MSNNNPSPDIKQLSGAIIIGDRVVVPSTGQKGTLRYWGTTEFKEGLWAGIELDENSGKNDGSVHGVSYFQCPQQRGLFVLAHRVIREQASSSTTPILTPSGAYAAATTKRRLGTNTGHSETPRQVTDTHVPVSKIPTAASIGTASSPTHTQTASSQPDRKSVSIVEAPPVTVVRTNSVALGSLQTAPKPVEKATGTASVVNPPSPAVRVPPPPMIDTNAIRHALDILENSGRNLSPMNEGSMPFKPILDPKVIEALKQPSANAEQRISTMKRSSSTDTHRKSSAILEKNDLSLAFEHFKFVDTIKASTESLNKSNRSLHSNPTLTHINMNTNTAAATPLFTAPTSIVSTPAAPGSPDLKKFENEFGEVSNMAATPQRRAITPASLAMNRLRHSLASSHKRSTSGSSNLSQTHIAVDGATDKDDLSAATQSDQTLARVHLADAYSQISKLQGDLSHMQSQYRNELSAVREQNQVLADEINRMKNVIRSQEVVLNEQEVEINRWVKEAEDIRQAKVELETEHQMRLGQIDKQITTLDLERSEEMEREREAFQAEKAKLREDYEKRFDRDHEKLDKMTSEKDRLRRELEEAREKWLQKENELEQRHLSLDKKLLEAYATMESLRKEKDGWKRERAAVADKIRIHQDEVSHALKKEAERYQAEVEARKQDLDKWSIEKAQLVKQVEAAEKNRNVLLHQLNEATSEAEQNRQELSDKISDNEKIFEEERLCYQKEVDQLKHQISTLREEVRSTSSTSAAAQEQRDNLLMTVESLSADNDILKQQIADLEAQCETSRMTVDRQGTELQALTSEISNLIMKNRSAEVERENSRILISNNEATLTNIKLSLSMVEKERDSLVEKLRQASDDDSNKATAIKALEEQTRALLQIELQLNHSITELTDEKLKLTKELHARNEEIGIVNNHAQAKQEQLSIALSENDRLQHQISNVLKEKDELSDSLNNALQKESNLVNTARLFGEQHERVVSEYKEKLVERDEALKKLESQEDSLRKQLYLITQQENTCKYENLKLSADVQRLSESLSSLQEQFVQKDLLIRNLRTEFEKELHKLKEEKDFEVQIASQYSAQCSILENEAKQVQYQLFIVQESSRKLEDQCAQLRNDLKTKVDVEHDLGKLHIEFDLYKKESEARIADFKLQIFNLNSTVNESLLNERALQSQLQSANVKSEILKSDLEARIQESESEIARCRTIENVLQEKLNCLMDSNKSLREENANLVAEIKIQSDRLKTEHERFEHSVLLLRDREKMMDAQLTYEKSAALSKITDLEKIDAARLSDIENLKRTVVAADDRAVSLQSKVKELSILESELNQQLQEYESAISFLTKDRTSRSNVIDSLNESICNMRTRLQDTEALLSQVYEKKDEVEKFGKESQIQSTLAKGRIVELEKVNAEHMSTLQSLRETLNVSNSETADLRSKLHNLDAQYQLLSEDVKRKEEMLEEHLLKQKTLYASMADLSKELEDTRDQLSEALSQNENHIVSIGEYKRKLMESNDHAQKIENELVMKTKEHSELYTSLQEIRLEKTALIGKINDSDKFAADITDVAVKLEKENLRLQTRLTELIKEAEDTDIKLKAAKEVETNQTIMLEEASRDGTLLQNYYESLLSNAHTEIEASLAEIARLETAIKELHGHFTKERRGYEEVIAERERELSQIGQEVQKLHLRQQDDKADLEKERKEVAERERTLLSQYEENLSSLDTRYNDVVMMLNQHITQQSEEFKQKLHLIELKYGTELEETKIEFGKVSKSLRNELSELKSDSRNKLRATFSLYSDENKTLKNEISRIKLLLFTNQQNYDSKLAQLQIAKDSELRSATDAFEGEVSKLRLLAHEYEEMVAKKSQDNSILIEAIEVAESEKNQIVLQLNQLNTEAQANMAQKNSDFEKLVNNLKQQELELVELSSIYHNEKRDLETKLMQEKETHATDIIQLETVVNQKAITISDISERLTEVQYFYALEQEKTTRIQSKLGELQCAILVDNAIMSAQKEQLLQEICQRQENLDSLYNSLSNERANRQMLEDSILKMINESSRLQQEHDVMQSDFENEIVRCNNIIRDLEAKLSSEMSNKDRIEIELENSQRMVLDLTKDIESHALDTKESLRAKNDELNVVRDKLTVVEKEFDSLKNDHLLLFETAQTKQAELRAEMKNLEDEIKSLSDELSELRSLNTATLDSKNSEIVELQNTVTKKVDLIASLKEELDLKSNELGETLDTLSRLQEAQEEELLTHQKASEEYQMQLNNRESELAALAEKLMKQTYEFNAKSEELEMLNIQYAEEKQLHFELHEHLKDLKENNANERAIERNTYQSRVQILEVRVAELTEQNGKLESELRKTLDVSSEESQELLSCKNHIAQLEEDIYIIEKVFTSQIVESNRLQDLTFEILEEEIRFSQVYLESFKEKELNELRMKYEQSKEEELKLISLLIEVERKGNSELQIATDEMQQLKETLSLEIANHTSVVEKLKKDFAEKAANFSDNIEALRATLTSVNTEKEATLNDIVFILSSHEQEMHATQVQHEQVLRDMRTHMKEIETAAEVQLCEVHATLDELHSDLTSVKAQLATQLAISVSSTEESKLTRSENDVLKVILKDLYIQLGHLHTQACVGDVSIAEASESIEIESIWEKPLRIQELTSQVTKWSEQLQSSINNHLEDISKLRTELSETIASKTTILGDLDTVKLEVLSLRNMNSTLEESLKMSNLKIDELQSQISSKRQEMDQLKNELNEANTLKLQIQSELDAAALQIASAREANATLQETVRECNNKINALQIQITEDDTLVQDLKSELQKTVQEMRSTQQANSEAEESIRALNSTVQDLQMQMVQRDQQITTMRFESEKRESEQNQVIERTILENSLLLPFKDEAITLRQQVDGLKAVVSGKEELVKSLESQLENEKQKIRAVTNEVSLMMVQQENDRKQITMQEQEMRELNEKLLVLPELKMQITGLEIEVNNAQTLREKIESDNNRLMGDIEALKKLRDEQMASLDANLKPEDANHRMMKSRTAEISRLDHELAEVLVQLDTERAELVKANASLKDAQEQLARVEYLEDTVYQLEIELGFFREHARLLNEQNATNEEQFNVGTEKQQIESKKLQEQIVELTELVAEKEFDLRKTRDELQSIFESQKQKTEDARDLNDQLVARDEKIAQLTELLAEKESDLSRTVEELRFSLEKQQEKIKDLEDQLLAKDQKITEFTEIVAEKELDLSKIRDELQSNLDAQKQMTEAARELNDQLVARDEKIAQLTERITEKESDLCRTQEELRSALQSQHEPANVSIDVTAAVKDLKDQLAAKDENIQKITELIVEREFDLRKAREELRSTLETQNQTIRPAVAITDDTAVVKDLKDQLKEKEKALEEKEVFNTETQKQVTELERRVDHLEVSLRQEKVSHAVALAAINQLTQENEDLVKKLSGLEKEKKNFLDLLDDQRRRLATLKGDARGSRAGSSIISNVFSLFYGSNSQPQVNETREPDYVLSSAYSLPALTLVGALEEPSANVDSAYNSPVKAEASKSMEMTATKTMTQTIVCQNCKNVGHIAKDCGVSYSMLDVYTQD